MVQYNQLKFKLEYNNNVIEVIRMNKTNSDKENAKKWISTKSPRITFQGALPERVTIKHTSYKVHQYTFPILRHFRSLRYGHGIMTCKNKMCSKCI